MRNVVLGLLAAVAVGPACGASRQQIETARTARYHGDQLAMFQAARSAVADRYQLATSDETTLRIETVGRWYTADGLGASERSGDMRGVPDRSIHLRVIVLLVPQGGDWIVAIEPVMMRYFTARPNPDRLAADDPSVPGWTQGRVDQLYRAIHQALGAYQVRARQAVPPRQAGAAALPASSTPPGLPPRVTP
jgi:hypothetical protein